MLFAQGMITANKQYGISFTVPEINTENESLDNTFQNAVHAINARTEKASDSIKVYTGSDFATSASGNEPNGAITARN